MRNLTEEIGYSRTIDWDTGVASETICFRSLIGIIAQLVNRIEDLEEQLADG